jgi:preprotein translocase subunit SecF
MEFFKKVPNIPFMRWRTTALVGSTALNLLVIGLLAVKGLNFGIDFTGGTLVELNYAQPVEIREVREALDAGGVPNAIVQHIGTTRDVLIRLRAEEGKSSAQQSTQIMEALRGALNETPLDSGVPGRAQQCRTSSGAAADCSVQLRRVEFVGPQVGIELVEKGVLALLYALFGIMIYVAVRFEWRFAVGAVVATLHDVLLTFGFYAVTRMEFGLVELAAVLTVMGYSINDTVVVYDRIRENFRKLRKDDPATIMNISINETLSRTVMTGVTTLMVVLSLFLFGGDSVHPFSAGLLFGILVGTYSSIFVGSPAVLALGLTRAHLLPVKKEGADQPNLQP